MLLLLLFLRHCWTQALNWSWASPVSFLWEATRSQSLPFLHHPLMWKVAQMLQLNLLADIIGIEEMLGPKTVR